MSDRLNIRNTPHGLLFEKPPKGERGEIKKAKWGYAIKVEGHRLNRNDLIKFINNQLEPSHPKLKKRCFKVSNKKIRAALKALPIENGKGTPEIPEPIVDIKVDIKKNEEKPFIEKISPRQLALYKSLKRPAEKQLYEQLYLLGESEPYRGIFVDLLLCLLKDRILDFQIRGNDITLHLIKGNGNRKFVGFELKGKYPESVTLRYDSERKKLFFIQGKLQFSYALFDIFSPKAVSLTPQGALIQAEFGSLVKSREEIKRLDRPLNTNQIYKIFE